MAFPADYSDKEELIISAAQVAGSSSLTDFAVMIGLGSIPPRAIDAGSASADNGGGDVRLSTDEAGTNQIACEIVNYVTNATEANQKCVIWAIVPSVSDTVDTSIWMWWDNPGDSQPAVTDTFGRNAVWGDEEAVLHFQNIDAADVVDSTGNHTVSDTGSFASSDDDGLVFGTSGNYLTIPEASSLDFTTALALRTYASNVNSQSFRSIISKPRANGTWNSPFAVYHLGIGNATELEPYMATTSTRFGIPAGNTISTGNAHYLSYTYSGSQATSGVDGSSFNNNTTSNTMFNSAEDVAIGSRSTSSTGEHFNGTIRSIRMRGTDLTDDWITTEYNNQNDPTTFIKFVPAPPTQANTSYMIRKNASDGSTTVTTSNADLAWDTEVNSNGSDITYSGGTFTLVTAGHYLILSSELWATTSTTNNERKEIQGRLMIGGTESIYGVSQGFIRQSGGSQEAAPSIGTIINTTSASVALLTRYFRTDNSTTGAPNRVVEKGGIHLMKLDDAWNYGRYRNSASQNFGTDDVFVDVTLDTSDEEDTGFSRSGNSITITNAGRYLVCYSAKSTNTSANTRTAVTMRIDVGGTPYDESQTYTYIRGSDSCNDGAQSWIGVMDFAASDVVKLQVMPDGDVGGVLDEANITLVQLPTGNETFIVEATTGNFNTVATDFAWDTQPHLDAAAFTYTNGNSNVDVDNDGDYLIFGNQFTNAGTIARAVPALQMKAAGSVLNGMSTTYNRNTVGILDAGINIGAIVPGIFADESLIAFNDRQGTASGSIVCQAGQFSGIRLDSIFPISGDVTVDLTAISRTRTTPALDVEAEIDYTAELSASARSRTVPALDVEAEIDYTAELSAIAQSRTAPPLDVSVTTDFTAELNAIVRSRTVHSLDVEAEIDYSADLTAVGRPRIIPSLDIEAEIDYTAELSAVPRNRTIPSLDVEAEIDYTAELSVIIHSRTILSLDIEAEIDFTAELGTTGRSRTVPALEVIAVSDYTAELSASARSRTVPALDIEAEIDFTAELGTTERSRTIPALDVEAEIDYTAELSASARSRTVPTIDITVVIVLVFPKDGKTIKAETRNRTVLRNEQNRTILKGSSSRTVTREQQNRMITRNKQNRSVKSE